MPYVGKKPADIIATAVDTTTGTFSGDLTVDTSTLYVDSANNRVGVGTVSPSKPLHVFNSGTSYVQISGNLRDLFLGQDATGGAIVSTGAVPMYFSTNSTERMRIDSSGNVGIGTSSPSTTLHLDSGGAITTLQIDSDTECSIDFNDHGGSAKRYKIGTNISSNDGQLEFKDMTANAERMRIDSSGRVGIGTGTTPIGDRMLRIHHSSSQKGIILVENNASMSLSGVANFGGQIDASSLKFVGDSNTERMRIDSSGNLMVGSTTTAPHTLTSGGAFTVRGSLNLLSIARADNEVMILNRTGSDGSIAQFRKNGSTVGSIGTATRPYFASPDWGVKIGQSGAQGYLEPTNQSGSALDNGINIGASGTRWKNLYLSGGVYLGGTGTANELDDYEEGTWIPALQFSNSTTGITYTKREGRFVKIGRIVIASFHIDLSSKGSVTGNASIAGLPFAHWDSTQHSNAQLIWELGGSSVDKAGNYVMPWTDSRLYIRYQGTTGYVNHTSTSFTNTSRIFATVVYETT